MIPLEMSVSVADEERPIIIKKIKKGGHGHHGGAWKVAYADFVTAMMAFFLLLWLLSSTTDEQREGIADYFTPTIGIKDSEGIGFQGGERPTEDGTKKDDLTPVGIVMGAPPTGEKVFGDPQIVQKDYEHDAEVMKQAEEDIKKMIEEDTELGRFKDNLLLEQTPEGLKIQIVDQHKLSMFKSGSAELEEHAKLILRKLVPILNSLPNRMSISGHTDNTPFGRSQAYTNWELSADRANATRRFFTQTPLEEEKVVVVSGKASREPLLPTDRANPRNRRISLILLYRHIYPFDVPATDELLAPPTPEDDAELDLRVPAPL